MSIALRGRAARASTRAGRAPDESTAVVTAPAERYVGLVTRALAFALDAAIINAGAILTASVVALAFSVLSVPDSVRTAGAAVGGVLYVLWSVGYFVMFWATTGQTPGNRALRIRVVPFGGSRLRPRRALLRFVGLTLAALPLFAGFLLVLVDDRRRGLHDLLARTAVVDVSTEDDPPARRGARTTTDDPSAPL